MSRILYHKSILSVLIAFTLATFDVLRMSDAIWPVSQLVTGRDRLARQEVECFCQHASHLLLAGRVNVLASAASPRASPVTRWLVARPCAGGD